MNKELFWFNNLSVLLNKEYFNKFIPIQNMTNIEKLNAIVRFCLYLSFLLILFTNNINYAFITIAALLITYYIHTNKDERENKDELENKDERENEELENTFTKGKEYLLENINNKNKKCIEKTKDNPLGNPTILDYTNEKINPCVLDSDIYEQKIFPIDSQDYLDTHQNNRQFIAVPNNINTGQRSKFLNWCFKPSN